MDFSFNDDQRAIRDLARRIFADHCAHERLKQVEGTDDGVDLDLWTALAGAGLTTIESEGGMSFLEACVILFEQGASVAPVALWPKLVAATPTPLAIDAAAITEPHSTDPYAPMTRGNDGRLTGTKTGVDFVDVAGDVFVTTNDGVYRLDASEPLRRRETSTTGTPTYTLTFESELAERVGDVTGFVDRAVVAHCALHAGVVDAALRLTASYVSEREQFDRVIGSFQAVQHRAADAYIDAEAVRWTMWQAAWALSEGRDAREAVAIARYWACEGGFSVTAAAQHLHGGIGIDLDYPLHRYFLWARQLEAALGGPHTHLARLGSLL